MKEASIAVVAANKCHRISVSYANILPGWKKTHFTAINVAFAGKLLRIGVLILSYNHFQLFLKLPSLDVDLLRPRPNLELLINLRTQIKICCLFSKNTGNIQRTQGIA